MDLLFRLRLTEVTKSFVVTFDFVHRRADSLGYPCKQAFPSKIADIFVRYSLEGLLRADIGRGIVLRIIKRQLKLQGIVVHALPGFLEPRMEAFRIAEIIEPCSFVKTNRIHDQRVPVPVRNRMSIPCRTKIFQVLTGRQLPAVGPHVSYSVFPLE